MPETYVCVVHHTCLLLKTAAASAPFHHGGDQVVCSVQVCKHLSRIDVELGELAELLILLLDFDCRSHEPLGLQQLCRKLVPRKPSCRSEYVDGCIVISSARRGCIRTAFEFGRFYRTMDSDPHGVLFHLGISLPRGGTAAGRQV